MLSEEQEKLNQLVEERMRQVMYGTEELPPLLDIPSQENATTSSDSEGNDNKVNNEVISNIPPAPQPISTMQSTPVSAMPVGVQVVSTTSPTETTTVIKDDKKVSTRKANSSKKEAIDVDQVAQNLVANFSTMDKLAIHELLLQIIGKSSSGLAKSLNMSPGNIILTSIRGGRQISAKNLDAVINAFLTDPNIEARPQVKALITKDLFLNEVKKEETASI